MSEFAGNASGGSLERGLDQQIRRAVGMLRFLLELTEEREANRGSIRLPLADLLRTKIGSSELSSRLGALRPSVQVPDSLICWGNRNALERALDFVFEVLIGAANSNGRLEITARCGEEAVELRLSIPSDQGDQLAAKLRRDVSPFKAADFAFHTDELPEASRVQAALEASGSEMCIEGSNSSLTFALFLQPGVPEPEPYFT
jgi:hypothetical protein